MNKFDEETIAYIIAEVIIAILSVFGNSLVCFVVLNSDSIRNKV